MWLPSLRLVARPCIVWRLLGTGGWVWFRRLMAVKPCGALGLILAHWYVELVLGGYRAGGTGSSVHLLVGRSSS